MSGWSLARKVTRATTARKLVTAKHSERPSSHFSVCLNVFSDMTQRPSSINRDDVQLKRWARSANSQASPAHAHVCHRSVPSEGFSTQSSTRRIEWAVLVLGWSSQHLATAVATNKSSCDKLQSMKWLFVDRSPSSTTDRKNEIAHRLRSSTVHTQDGSDWHLGSKAVSGFRRSLVTCGDVCSRHVGNPRNESSWIR